MFYNDLKPKHPEFELIFVSLDDSKKSMLSYMSESQMPWPAVNFDNKKTVADLNQYRGGGIPCLVLLDAHGKVLSNTFIDGDYIGPGKVLDDIEAKLGEVQHSGASPKLLPPDNGRNPAPRA
jgi:nucleoredoxin